MEFSTFQSKHSIYIYLVLYFAIRLVLVLTSLFLSVVAVLYAVSFFCPVYDEAQVTQNSIEKEWNKGDPDTSSTCLL